MTLHGYSPLMMPLPGKPFEEFSREEAQRFLDWYVGQSEERIGTIEAYCRQKAGGEVVFDGTVESLKTIWAWFEGQITIRERTEEEIQARLRGRPAWMEAEIRKNSWELSELTYAMAIDLSFYFADVFMKHHPSIRWGFIHRPKYMASVNRPALVGFIKKMYMDPRVVMLNCCRRSAEQKAPDRLLELYTTWSAFVPAP